MIDRIARNNLAERLRQLASGSITNFEFERRGGGRSDDPAIRAIEFEFAWTHYDDFHEHRLDGRFKLTDRQRCDFARAVVFLKSDLEYRWPSASIGRTIQIWLVRVLSFGAWMPAHRGGDLDVWPFYTQQEYRLSLRAPPYLCGCLRTL